MDADMVTYLIIGLVLGFIIGVICANILSPKSRKFNQVKRELDEAKQELVTQKQMVVKHFSSSAEILDNMAKEFRRLYQHMAENSTNLLSQKDLEMLNVPPNIQLTNNNNSNEEQPMDMSPPKDYSGTPSGLFKNESVEPK